MFGAGQGTTCSRPVAITSHAARDFQSCGRTLFRRQLKKEEQVGMSMTMSMDASGGWTMGMKPQGEGQELRTTDAYKLEVFGPDGVLLGSLPLDLFVDGIFIFGDRLFLMDRYRGTQFKEYRIKG